MWGRKSNISLLDQHTELKKLAEGKRPGRVHFHCSNWLSLLMAACSSQRAVIFAVGVYCVGLCRAVALILRVTSGYSSLSFRSSCRGCIPSFPCLRCPERIPFFNHEQGIMVEIFVQCKHFLAFCNTYVFAVGRLGHMLFVCASIVTNITNGIMFIPKFYLKCWCL